MNKSRKCIVGVVAFLVATVAAISLFGLFSAWAMSELGPAQQETIGAINTPWISAQRNPALAPGKPDTIAARKAASERAVAKSTAAKP